MKVGLVIPWRETATRIDAFNAALKRHREIFPDLPIYKGDSSGPYFNPSEARNRGCLAALADGCEVLAVLDADTLFDSLSLTEAIEIAIRTKLVCYPYTYAVDLSPGYTLSYLTGELDLFLSRDEGPGDAVAKHVGSGWVMTAEVFEKLNGWDENFLRWGYEDNAFQETHLKMLGAPMERAAGRCYKLHHDERDIANLMANRDRFFLYEEATPDTIRELVSNNLVHQKKVNDED